MLPPVLPPITPAPLVRPRVGFSRRATRHFVKGGNREKHFCCPLLTIFRGGGQEKCLLYSNNKKKTLPIPDIQCPVIKIKLKKRNQF